MSSQDSLLHDLYGDQSDYEYHQDHRGQILPWPESPSIIVAVLALVVGLIYTLLHALDFDLLSLPELLWNFLVFITPSRLLDILDNDVKLSSAMNPRLRSIPRAHAAKAEVLRRFFGFDRAGGIVGTVAQAGRRRLSSLSGISMSLKGDDERPPGLGNWDNSCYQNSVLQGLASLDTLPKYLEDSFQWEEATGDDKSDMRMGRSLRGLIEQLTDPSNNGSRIWTPATLKSMSSWQQQDAQEYFSKVLDEIDKEISKASTKVQPALSLEAECSAVVHTAEDLSSTREKQSSFPPVLRNPLEGMLAQRVGCTRCGYSEGLSLIPFNCLTVPLGKAWYYDISECLDEYTKLEPIEGVECGKCTLLKTQNLLKIILDRLKDRPDEEVTVSSTTSRLQVVSEALDNDDYDDKTLSQKCKIPPKNRVTTTKSRQAVIARPPKSLAIHVNRSVFDELTGELKKNYAEVRFPKQLDLGRWALGSSGTSNKVQFEEWVLDPAQSMIAGKDGVTKIRGPIYQLRAVITHYGRHENGHYIAYRKHPVTQDIDEKTQNQEQWWRLSDDDVSKVTEENVLDQGGVFMLFYDCVEPAESNTTENAVASSISNTVEIAMASEIPLPEDSDDELGRADTDDQISARMSPEPSITASSISEDEGTPDAQEYHPTRPILIPQYIQSSGIYHNGDEERNERKIGSTGNMVMV